MFPERLPHDVQSEAERRVFDAFRDQFSDDWVVFSQVRWLSVNSSSRASDGEADFIVAHPRYGVLVLEVKGGGIAYDAAKSQYTSTDSAGRVHRIKDPFRQASRSKFALIDKLREAPLTNRFQYTVEHGVILPDIFTEGDLGLDAPREIVVDLARMPNLKQAIVDMFRYYGAKRDEIPDIAVEALVDLLGRSWQIEATIGTSIAQQEEVVRLLTEKQFMVLDLLTHQRRALISGCAGSGKTMLAIEKAKRLAREGYRVLLTCFNQNLANWLARVADFEGVEVSTFLSLCARRATDAGLEVQKGSEETDQQFFGRFPYLLLEALEKNDERFDAIIVDEGQDFEEDWWGALQSLLADPEDGTLYIFFDDNQRLYGRNAPFPIKDAPFPLNQNCRNTKRIHEAVVMFYESEVPPVCLNADGREPHLVNFDGPERPGIESFIADLVTKQNVKPNQIAILTRKSRDRSDWKNPPQNGTWTATWDLADDGDKVLVSTVHGFKGLERPVIIVCELQDVDLQEQRELLYVAFSRAREYLVVVGLEQVPAG
jgi:hypothetical protein